MLSVFIAWINLDFGVETCFYSGMDIYQKTWLQFVFPLYIWLLVGSTILVSHYSTSATKIFGRNIIAVLATLFLLSYTKILKTIFTALQSTQVLQGSANDTNGTLIPYRVWSYDGNIERKACATVCSSLGVAGLSLPSVHPAPDVRSVHTLLANTEEMCAVGHTQHSIHLHLGCLPCSLQEGTSLLDWAHAVDTLRSLLYLYLQLQA